MAETKAIFDFDNALFWLNNYYDFWVEYPREYPR